jgi:hypothetical protein
LSFFIHLLNPFCWSQKRLAGKRRIYSVPAQALPTERVILLYE